MKTKRRLLAGVIILSFLLTACSGLDDAQEKKSSAKRSSLKIQLSDDGSLNIERPARSGKASKGKDGTWTIFVYMCGSDLESENGLATMDIEEMMSVSTGENIKFVVQTGGAGEWQNEQVDASAFQRYVICDGEAELADEQDVDNMGESQSLSDFLQWGIDAYPAQNTGLILWNHGGGSISGVCFDEQYENDSLSLRELDAALLSVYDMMGDNFEFIGFDACLMGTVECANVLASYSDYMYGSQETEPGYGWDYAAIGGYLAENSSADGAQLGKVVADSFYEACDDIGEGNAATLSVVDLSKVDDIITSFNTFAQNLYTSTEDADSLSGVVRNVMKIDNYGGNNKSAGYTNMVDFGGLLEAGSAYADGADDVMAALEEAVVYTRNGSDHKQACGLSTYYPLQIQGSMELQIFGDIAISPYYLSFVDRAAYGAAQSGDVSDYDNEGIFDFWGSYEYDDDGSYDSGDDGYWDYYEDYEQTGESPLITFDVEPMLDEDGSYGFVLSEEGLQNAASVQANVYMLSDDGQDVIELGISTDIYMDWETGTFTDNFDGYWFSLPDGQNLAVYIVTEGDGYDVYSSPVEINGEQTNLLFTHDYVNGTVTIDGIWAGIDENGMAAREIWELDPGDEIVPLYYAVDIDTEEDVYYYGESYLYEEDTEIVFDILPDGEYLYGFFIDDVYGDYYGTDYVNFTMMDGEPYYNEE